MFRAIKLYDTKLDRLLLKIDKKLVLQIDSGKISYILECYDIYYNHHINQVLQDYGFTRLYDEITKRFTVIKYQPVIEGIPYV